MTKEQAESALLVALSGWLEPRNIFGCQGELLDIIKSCGYVYKPELTSDEFFAQIEKIFDIK